MARRFLSLKPLPPHRLMPMPRLSPSMHSGRLRRWLSREGDELNSMEVLCEVETTELTDESSGNGDSSPVVLEIESHEEGYLAKILVAEGEQAECDTAIAVVCERESDLPAFTDYNASR